MTEMSVPSRLAHWLAWGWLAVVLVVSGHNAWLWTGGRLQLDTDLLAMLPQNEREPLVQDATRKLADAATRRIVVLVGGGDWVAAQRAGDAFAARLQQARLPLAIKYRVDEAEAAAWLEFFAPYRHGLLTDAQRAGLQTKPTEALVQEAMAALYQPLGMPRVGAWQADPLNLFGGWLASRASDSKVRVTDGRLSLDDGDRHYALLMLELQGAAFSITAQQAVVPELAEAGAAARAVSPQVRVHHAGVPLHAAAAAEQAEREVHTIGVGSLLGIVLLTLLVFSAVRPRLLVMLSIAIGLLAAISACVLIFGRLHLITVVFGASLVGVAENYGSNYFCNRQGRPAAERWMLLREQGPVMWLAMLTTVIGYALLAVTPFPGLQQIAVFSAAGLLAAFVTVLWWFPWLDGGRPLGETRWSRWIGGWRARWPTFGRNRLAVAVVCCTSVLLLAGVSQLHSNDDIRQLQSAPPQLVADQLAVGRLLDLPSPAQFYLVQGNSPEQVLQREEALKQQLAPLLAQGALRGVQAISDWVPSARQQAEARALQQHMIFGAKGVLALAARQLDESVVLPHLAAPTLTVQQWLSAPVSEPLRAQWLGRLGDGYASVVLLRGVESAARLPALADVARTVAGVRWVDKVGEVSEVMARYRLLMGWVIVAGYLLVFAALSIRFGRQAWRALLPTAVASAMTVALLAVLGQPLQLFNVLALLLILGMGVDYGIFMLEQPGRDQTRPFLSITLAAACTLLAFGLLALSSTPALRAFGLTMLFGIALSWLLAPFFLPAVAGCNDRSDLERNE